IADDDAKPAKGPEAAPPAKQTAAAAPPTPPVPPAKPATTPALRPAAATNSQDEIDAMLADLDGPPKATPKPAQAAAPDVLDLTEPMTTPVTPPPGPAPSFRTIDAKSDVVFANRPEPAPPPMPDRGLISNETVKAVDSAFNTLAQTVIGQNARTLEDLV